MTDTALTPFQRRLEYWENTHVRQTISSAGTDLVEAMKRHQKSMISSANSIIISQERIAEGIEELSAEVSNVYEGLNSLAGIFTWGFAEIAWQLEQQSHLLTKVKEILEAPLDTEALNIKRRAEKAYKNGWTEDALEDFLEAEKKNRYDFTVHQYLGDIYFFEHKNFDMALSYYEKAVKYSRPESRYHTSFALLHIGLLRHLNEEFERAYAATAEAIELSPDLLEAHYQHAQYCAVLKRKDEAIKHIKKAVDGNLFYLIKADKEQDFAEMKDNLLDLSERIRSNLEKTVKAEIALAKRHILNVKEFSIDTYSSTLVQKLVKDIREAERLFGLNSILDFERSYELTIEVQKEALSGLKFSLEKNLKENIKEITELKEQIKKIKEDLYGKDLFYWVLLVAALIVGLITKSWLIGVGFYILGFVALANRWRIPKKQIEKVISTKYEKSDELESLLSATIENQSVNWEQKKKPKVMVE